MASSCKQLPGITSACSPRKEPSVKSGIWPTKLITNSHGFGTSLNVADALHIQDGAPITDTALDFHNIPRATLAAPRAAPGGPLAAPAALLAAPCGPLTTPCCCLPCALRCPASPRSACCATMASLRVLAFDHEGRPLQFDTWLDDMQLYLLSDSRDSVSWFDHTSGAAPAPPAIADSATRSQWLTRDAARLAIRNHLPLAECAHFGQHMTAQALYDAVVARYSSPATAALG
ncbi:unnamed protein product [Closterium sp. NIES-54]